jgi:phosphomannomutase
MEKETNQRIQQWLHEPYDSATRAEVEDLVKKGEAAVSDAFYTTLSFGTGGMRGLMGAGTARMNRYTVQRATQGLAKYLQQQFPGAKIRVLIGYDSRHHSEEFAHEAAKVLAGNGITALLCTEIRPTPFVSFGVRQMKCQAGIMITASHNPKQYNGYKVYWSDGAQVTAPHDEGIMRCAQGITSQEMVHMRAEHDPLIEKVSPRLDLEYLKEIRNLSLHGREDHHVGDALKIVYTPLHGTGMTLLPKALKEWGFANLHFVDAQIVPDGDFPTVVSPNPEEHETLRLGLDLLQNSGGNLLLASDPDADRLAVAILHKGKPVTFNGNQIAALCAEYLCRTLREQKKLLPSHAIVTTIVSTRLLSAIARAYKVAYFEVLTGFKYIGALIHEWEQKGNPYHFLFGAEESYGYLFGTYTRDKDAMIAACLVAEIALMLKIEGRTLVDFLEEIFQTYGHFLEKQKSLSFPPGEEGMKALKAKMESLRRSSVQKLGGIEIAKRTDYLEQQPSVPLSDVLQFDLKDQSRVTLRPSGTEPKLKLYVAVQGKTEQECQQKVEALCSGLL